MSPGQRGGDSPAGAGVVPGPARGARAGGWGDAAPHARVCPAPCTTRTVELHRRRKQLPQRSGDFPEGSESHPLLHCVPGRIGSIRGAERGSFGKRKEPAPFPKPQRWGLCSVCPNATPRSGPAVAPKFLGGRRIPETPLGEGTVPGPLHILERTGRNSSGTTRHVGLRNEGRHTWLLVIHGRGSPSALKGPSRGRTRPGGITLGPPRGRTGPRPSLWAPPEAGPGWGCHSEPPGVSLLLQVLPQVLLPLLLHHLVELHGGSGILHRGMATFPYLWGQTQFATAAISGGQPEQDGGGNLERLRGAGSTGSVQAAGGQCTQHRWGDAWR